MTFSRIAVLALLTFGQVGCGGGAADSRGAAPPAPAPSPGSPAGPTPQPGAQPDPPAMPGATLWTAPLGEERPLALAVNEAGSVFAATVARLVRFTGEGERAWAVALPHDSAATHLAAAPGGALLGLTDGEGHLALARYSDAGELSWSAAVVGVRFLSLDADARGRALALVVVNGSAPRAVLVEADGRAARDLEVEAGSRRAAFVGDGGDFVVAGQEPGTSRPFVARATSDGVHRWRRRLDTPRGAIDRLAVGPGGAVVIGGWFDERLRWGATTHARLVKGQTGFVAVAAADGAPRWSISDEDLRPSGAEPSLAAFAADGRVVVHTTTSAAHAANLRAHGDDGRALWRHEFPGLAGTSVECVAVNRGGSTVIAARDAAGPAVQGGWYVAVLAP